MQKPQPKHPAQAELERVRQVQAQRRLVQLAELIDALADVIQMAQEGSGPAMQVLGRIRVLAAQLPAASVGLVAAPGGPES